MSCYSSFFYSRASPGDERMKPNSGNSYNSFIEKKSHKLLLRKLYFYSDFTNFSTLDVLSTTILESRKIFPSLTVILQFHNDFIFQPRNSNNKKKNNEILLPYNSGGTISNDRTIGRNCRHGGPIRLNKERKSERHWLK